MEIYVSLFGEKKDVFDWLRLLEQEKVPFKYRGESLNNFSCINILVGFSKGKIEKFLKKKKDRIYLLESVFTLPSREKLIKAYKLLNIPYIHFWYYPTPRPSIFLFRIDVDYVYLEGLKNLLKISKKFGIKGTYFLNISGEEEFDEEIGHLKLKKPTTPERKEIMLKILEEDNEIANHGYWHYVFDNFKKNRENIKKCQYYLKKLFDINARGFASPGWRWNKEMARAVNKSDFLYSSHTVSAKGEFPFHEYYDNKKMSFLEIPFFDISDVKFESILKSSRNYSNVQKIAKKLRGDYLKYIDEQIKHNRPIAIMGHPHLIGKIANSVLSPLFKKISRLKIPNYTLKEFAEWWKQREKFRLKYYMQNGKIIIHSNSSAFAEIIFQENKKIIKLSNKIPIILNL
jgi:peptidoglycan/xylan/chitin deacetylase (PgdA/CDA1 family)